MAGESEESEKSLSASEYKVVRATMADRGRLVAFLTTVFYKDEPINVAMGLEDNVSLADMDHTLKYLSEGRSLLAVAGERILGVAINGEITANEGENRARLLAECTCEDFKVFLTFWTYAERAAKCWHEDGPGKAMELAILAVDPQARGRGIGRALVDHTRNMARQEGYQLFRMDCSSFYAAQLAEMAGMTCVFVLPYEDYKNENGEPVLKVPPPHTALKMFMQDLEVCKK